VGGFIPDEKIAEVRDSANIVDVISQHVSLKKAGKNHVGLCPFHADKDPSFTVSEEKQIFHCFGCGQGGNAFNFLMQYHSIGFPEAVRMLAQKQGIVVSMGNISPEQKHQLKEKDRVFQINALAAKYLRHCLLKSPSGKVAREYLKKRKMTSQVIDRFLLGYAPPGWENMRNYMASQGISLPDAEKTGLIIPKKNGYYDRFRARIMFPIIDIHDRIVGFGGRCTDDSLPKYLNSPETPVYHKSRSLYGLPTAKDECRHTGTVFLVEGYFDVLALNCHGIHNVVAALGTAVTRQHIRVLKGYAKKVILVFDSDEAGMKAAERSLPLFAEEKIEAYVMTLPDGRDPDSYIFEVGADKFRKRAENASDMMTFFLSSAIKKYGFSLQGKIRIVDALKGPIGALPDSVSRAVYVKELAERLEIDESAILEKIRNSTRKSTYNAPKPSSKNVSRLEETLIAMMLQSPEVFSDFNAQEVVDSLETAALRTLGRLILEKYRRNEIPVGADLINEVEDPKIRKMISSLSVEEKSWDRESCMKIIGQYKNNLRKRQEKVLLKKIKAAEKADNQVLLTQLLEEKQKGVLERSLTS
jgi:DNA primase